MKSVFNVWFCEFWFPEHMVTVLTEEEKKEPSLLEISYAHILFRFFKKYLELFFFLIWDCTDVKSNVQISERPGYTLYKFLRDYEMDWGGDNYTNRQVVYTL